MRSNAGIYSISNESINADDFISKSLYVEKQFEYSNWRQIFDFLINTNYISHKNNIMLIDIGANNGVISIQNINGKAPVFGYVPQKIEFPKHLQMTVGEYLQYSANVPINQIKTTLQQVDFPESHIEKRITELSGGQIQKLLLAAELYRSPDILFLDEPLSNVDDASERHIIDVIMEIKNQGVTIVIITHDWQMISVYANHVICLNKNIICETSESCICRNSLSKINIQTIQKATPDPNSVHDGYCYIQNI